MGSGDGGGRGAARGGGRGPPREKDVLVAAGEVVGRPLAVWSQKLLDWPKARIGGWRPETREHLVKFDSPPGEGQPAEQWVRLGSVRFQWLAEQPESAAPNPTAAGAPKGDNCVGRRLKVFWPGMGRWYQGKVQSYDPSTRRHCIKYRDGDIQELRLCHEAIIWVDAGPRPPVARAPAAAPPAAAGGSGGNGSGAAAARSRHAAAAGSRGKGGGNGGGGAAAPSPAIAAAPGNARGGSPAAAKRPRTEESSGDEHLRSNKSSATREAAPPAAKPRPAGSSDPGAGAGAGGSSNIGSAASGQSMDVDREELGSSASDGESGDGGSSIAIDDLEGSDDYSSDLGEEAESDFEVESSRPGNRRPRRPGGASAGAPGGRSHSGVRKRSGGSRRSKKGGGGRRRKRGAVGGGDRQGSMPRPRDSGRPGASFRPTPGAPGVRPEEEAARAGMAGRSVVGARVEVLWAQDGQFYRGKVLQFDSYHKRSKILYDDGEEEWVSLAREKFRWLTPRGRSAGFIGEMRDALLQLAAQRDAVPGGGGSAASALASPAPRGEVADVAVKGSPKAEAAVGWQVSVLFDGDGQWYRGEVLAYNPQRGCHLVLYEDGEDEWLALERESLAWHKLAPRSAAAACPGIRPGVVPPRGPAAVGWRVGVFWALDKVFYTGQITAFDSDTDRHTVAYDDGEVRSVSLALDKIKWILPPGAIVDASKLMQRHDGAEAPAPARTAGGGMRRKANGEDSDPDFNYEYERSVRGAMRKLPRLLTTTSLASPGADMPALHAEASLGGQQQGYPGSPLWSPGSLVPSRSVGSIIQMPLSPTAETPLGEPLLVRQLTRVPVIGSGEAEAVPLPTPVTVRIYMSGSAAAANGGGGEGAAGEGGAPGVATPVAGAAGPARSKHSAAGRLSVLDLMTRRVARAQHTLLKGVPTHLPPLSSSAMAAAQRQEAAGAGASGGKGSQHPGGQQQQQRYGPVMAGLHRLARASTADNPLSPVHRRPHPALSDEEGSSSGSSDGESDREVSPSALLSPRSAAALNGAKIKPDTAQQAQQQQDSALDSLMLDSEGCGTGAATPCDSDALGPVPPLLRPAPGGHLDSPFSAGGLLRSSPGPGGLPPPHVYAGKPLFSEGGARPGHGHGPGTGAAAAGGAAAHAAGGGSAAGLGMARSMSLTGGMLDGIALPPAADPMHSLLPVTGPARHDSEFNLLAMAGGDLAPMDDGGLMDLAVGVGTDPHATEAAGPGGGLGPPAALADHPAMDG